MARRLTSTPPSGAPVDPFPGSTLTCTCTSYNTPNTPCTYHLLAKHFTPQRPDRLSPVGKRRNYHKPMPDQREMF